MVNDSPQPFSISGIPNALPTGGGGVEVFDSEDALAINAARMAHLDSLGLPIAGRSVLDVGCGVGRLAQFFVERGCSVTCVDGRAENIASLQSRYPGLPARVANVETDSLASLGRFDIVFCYGLFYHLENPIGALRNMAEACAGLLLLETVVTDHTEPILRLLDEAVETANQALAGLATRPSPAYVVMALNRLGFPYVYAAKHPPQHPDFQFDWRNDLEFSRDGHLLRCIFVASRQPLNSPELSLPREQNGASSVQRIATNADATSPRFNPAAAYWNQRAALASARDRILALGQAVNYYSNLLPYQWAQLMAMVMEYEPDLVLELGRGKGNSTCAFAEASNLKHGGARIFSVCLSRDWELETAPRVRGIVPSGWFEPLEIVRANILDFDFESAVSGAKRVLIFWDAHGFDIAGCVLGKILPLVAEKEHLVIMHDLSDSRYGSEAHLEYGEHGLWKGNNWSGPRVKLGIIDSAAEQSVAVVDFATRNHLTLDSADHSFHTNLTAAQQSEMRSLLGDFFDTQAHWFYFSLNERPGPYKFPRYVHPADSEAEGGSARSQKGMWNKLVSLVRNGS